MARPQGKDPRASAAPQCRSSILGGRSEALPGPISRRNLAIALSKRVALVYEPICKTDTTGVLFTLDMDMDPSRKVSRFAKSGRAFIELLWSRMFDQGVGIAGSSLALIADRTSTINLHAFGTARPMSIADPAGSEHGRYSRTAKAEGGRSEC